MQTLLRLLVATTLAVVLSAQNKLEIKRITVAVGPSDPPLNSASCKESSYGDLHNGQRTNLTPAEVGEYVLRTIKEGNIITVYPESKNGIFVYARCPNSEPKDVR
jgi:hypothetical protein